MSDESKSTESSPEPITDLGILPEGPIDADPTTEPSQEAPEASTEEPTQADGGEAESPPQQSAETDAETSDATVADEGTPAAKFEFMGKEYDSREAAEAALSSWEGRIKAEHERRLESDKRLEEYYRYVQEAHAKNEELYKQLQDTQKPEEEKTEEPKDFVETLDWEEIQRVQQIAANEGHDPNLVGMRMIAQKMDEHYKGQLDSLKSELSAPIEAAQDQDRFNTAAAELFVWAQAQETEEGAAFYPELKLENGQIADLEFVQDMYSAWQKLAQENPQFGFSPEGADYAYRLASDAHNSAVSTETPTESGQPETGEAPSQVTPARDVKGRFAKAKDAAVETASEGSTVIDPTKSAPPVDEGTELLARMGAIKTVQRGQEDLGFYE